MNGIIIIRGWSRLDLTAVTTFGLKKTGTQKMARLKTGKPQKSRKSRKFFSEIFKSKFLILALGQNRKLGKKKTWNNFSKISEVSKVSEFSTWPKKTCSCEKQTCIFHKKTLFVLLLLLILLLLTTLNFTTLPPSLTLSRYLLARFLCRSCFENEEVQSS